MSHPEKLNCGNIRTVNCELYRDGIRNMKWQPGTDGMQIYLRYSLFRVSHCCALFSCNFGTA